MDDSSRKTETDLPGFLARVIAPAGLVEYQKGAIVSKKIFDKKTGSVTLFAFDAGESLTEHTSPFDAVVQIMDGEARIRIAGKPHSLRSGEMILMPANIPHALEATKKFKMILTMIR